MTVSDANAVPRLEAMLKVTGAARYEAERHIEGMLHAALTVAPIAAGEILRIDTAPALALDGVVSVLTHENAPRIARPGFLIPLQERRVHFAGQPVALVLAETPALARRAAHLVAVTYAPLPAVTSVAQGLGETFAPKMAGRVETDSRRGDPERGFAEAEITIAERYTTPVNNHHPLEPHAVIADFEGGRLTVHTTTQAVFAHRQALADCFGLGVDEVRVVSKYLGGGFGTKGGAWFPCLVLGVMAAREARRPVKLELSRAEMFTLVGRRQETLQELRLGATREGHLTAITHDTIAQTSTYADYADPVGTPARMLYACANVATSHRLVRVNAPQPNPMRAPGEGPGSFALESGLDELAHELDIDPLELRLRNHADHDQHAGLPWSSNSLRECCRVGAERFGWDKRPRQIGAVRQGRNFLGWGMACAAYPVYRMASAAGLRIDAEGAVQVRCGTQDMGTGTYTVLAQLAASALGVTLAKVSVELGDTELPEGPYSGGSIATASFAPAVEEAAHLLRGRLIALAIADPGSPLHGTAAESLTIAEGLVRGEAGNRSESLAGLLARAAPGGLEAMARAAPPEKPQHSSYGYGAVFAEVSVDPELGELRVARIAAAYAAGRILNPLLARSQLVGGLIGGIGMALHETVLMDEPQGRIVNDNLADYLIPVHADMPHFDIDLVEEDDPHLGSGVKGIGMLGTVGIAGAIANALFHATGRRVRSLPIRIEHVLAPPSPACGQGA
ncbi:xanthine dehydrogenase YagR molybdenum-binding subunit [Rhizobiales bacterium GAS113]|nr:xanthine dehydrogenase YagR molybdenum-binding subunit [Rhizobiales bacterium GAS113]